MSQVIYELICEDNLPALLKYLLGKKLIDDSGTIIEENREAISELMTFQDKGVHAIHVAAFKKKPVVFDWLASQFDCFLGDSSGNSPGLMAAKQADLEWFLQVLRYAGFVDETGQLILGSREKAEAYLKNNAGEFAALISIRGGNKDVTHWLLTHFGTHHVSNSGVSLAFAAAAAGDYETTKRVMIAEGMWNESCDLIDGQEDKHRKFLSTTANVHIVHAAVEGGNVDLLSRLVDQFGCHMIDNRRRTTGHTAICFKQLPALQYLMGAKGYVVDGALVSPYEYTALNYMGLAINDPPLVRAVKNSDHAMLKWLLSIMSPEDSMRYGIMSPGLVAVHENDFESLMLLLNHLGYLMPDGSVKPECVDRVNQYLTEGLNGNHAIHTASIRGYTKIATWLARNLRCIHFSSWARKTPLEFAITFGKFEVFHALLEFCDREKMLDEELRFLDFSQTYVSYILPHFWCYGTELSFVPRRVSGAEVDEMVNLGYPLQEVKTLFARKEGSMATEERHQELLEEANLSLAMLEAEYNSVECFMGFRAGRLKLSATLDGSETFLDELVKHGKVEHLNHRLSAGDELPFPKVPLQKVVVDKLLATTYESHNLSVNVWCLYYAQIILSSFKNKQSFEKIQNLFFEIIRVNSFWSDIDFVQYLPMLKKSLIEIYEHLKEHDLLCEYGQLWIYASWPIFTEAARPLFEDLPTEKLVKITPFLGDGFDPFFASTVLDILKRTGGPRVYSSSVLSHEMQNKALSEVALLMKDFGLRIKEHQPPAGSGAESACEQAALNEPETYAFDLMVAAIHSLVLPKIESLKTLFQFKLSGRKLGESLQAFKAEVLDLYTKGLENIALSSLSTMLMLNGDRLSQQLGVDIKTDEGTLQLIWAASQRFDVVNVEKKDTVSLEPESVTPVRWGAPNEEAPSSGGCAAAATEFVNEWRFF